MRKLAVFTGLIVLASFACRSGLEAPTRSRSGQHPLRETFQGWRGLEVRRRNPARGNQRRGRPVKVGDKTYKLSCLRGQRIEAESAPRPPSAHHPGPGACHNRPASRASRPSRREVSNMANKTPMISPWSTIPRPRKTAYVSAPASSTPFQGRSSRSLQPRSSSQKAAVLYDIASDYPRVWPSSSRKAFEKINGAGSVVASRPSPQGQGFQPH